MWLGGLVRFTIFCALCYSTPVCVSDQHRCYMFYTLHFASITKSFIIISKNKKKLNVSVCAFWTRFQNRTYVCRTLSFPHFLWKHKYTFYIRWWLITTRRGTTDLACKRKLCFACLWRGKTSITASSRNTTARKKQAITVGRTSR